MTKNSGIKIYTKCLESILVTPTASYDKQVEENKRLLNVNKLSNEFVMGKSTKDTAMELDGEGAANFEQLQDLIQNKCDKRVRKYARVEEKCNKLEQQVTKKDHKNMLQRGQPPNNDGSGASKKNKSNKRQAPNQPSTRPKSATANNPGRQNQRISESPCQVAETNRGSRLKMKANQCHPCKTNPHGIHTIPLARKIAKNATTKKLIAQFGFASDPTLSTRHNASITLATMPTWYYFSRPSNLAFHDFTKNHKPEKNLFISWSRSKLHPDP